MKCPTPAYLSKPLFILFLLYFFLAGSSAVAQSEPPSPPGMVYIPEGYFQMGSNTSKWKNAQPMHFVYTSGFFIDKYEVSNAQYEEFMTATGHSAPKFWEDERFNKPEYPVVGVGWYDAMAYAKWKGGRLPTEAEWEKAARGRDGRLYPWGGKWDKGSHLFFVNVYGIADKYAYTAPTTYYQTGASPFGVYNLAGNVWEWCLDWYDDHFYRNSPEINPEGPFEGKTRKSIRGGSWVNGVDNVQAVVRAKNYPHIKNNMTGFRIVKTLQ